MSFEAAERIARALLFEGYVLYPYRASALKNQRRFAFGTLYSKAFCDAAAANDASRTVTELVVTGPSPRVRIVVKFLQLVPRAGDLEGREALERSIDTGELALPALADAPRRFEASFATSGTDEVRATLTVSATELLPSVWKLSTSVQNDGDTGPVADDRAAAELRALSSVHTLLSCHGGRFVSQTDPPPALEEYVRGCTCAGAWPVLVGAPGSADTVLASPIILSDYPNVAPASPGDLFDATEIDEILSLRILTLTDSEKDEVRRSDPRARALLERTEALGEKELLALHGLCAVDAPTVTRERVLAPGDHVVLRPGSGGDVFDLALSGQPATVLGVEESVEGRVFYTVTVDADPGRDLGELGLPGHRFFFAADELERVS